MGLAVSGAPATADGRRALRAQYFGMVSEVDAQFGRVVAALKASGQWDDTVVVLTADHGEQLCDHGLIEKLGFFEQSYAVPCLIHDPAHPEAYGSVVDAFTENVDLLPTLAAALHQDVPAQCDGLPLQPFLEGSEPPWWRTAAHYEWDWRYLFIGPEPAPWPLDRTLERQNLAVVRSEGSAYVHFGDGSWRCFDLAADPTWRTTTEDPAAVLPAAQALLSWRQEHLDRTLTDMLLQPGRPGRWPEVPAAGPV
jgi:arylsulfatase A-like enzyme